jgi:ubiquinone/menaquinone biosynthesis C-methylase UbiE
LGGGSGDILKELEKLNISLTISYVELSTEMIKLSQLELPFKNLKIQFINANALEIALPKVDVVMTHFF